MSEPGDEVEESSGYVLDRDGVVHFFWFGWDPARGAPILTEWEREEPQPHWKELAEYRQARERLHLAPA
jgi:hypothetical protein